MSQFVRRPAANRDLVAIFRHYARQAGMRVADRFFAQAEATFARLAGMPGMGTRYTPDEPLHADLRYFPFSRFRMYLIFYRPIPGGIEVLRVLHGTRDIQGILEEEFGIDEDVGGDAAGEMTDEPWTCRTSVRVAAACQKASG
jgi:toxin ParE1/3/4